MTTLKSRKDRMFARRKSLLLIIALVVVAGVLAAILGQGNSAAARPERARAGGLGLISSPGGQPVSLTTRDVAALGRFASSGQSLSAASPLATRGGRTYYRVGNGTGADCFSIGPAQATDFYLGQIMCAPDFPSVARPVLDFTVLTQPSSNSASARVVRSEGFAADGVADVAFQTPDGKLADTTPVLNNVYVIATPPARYVTGIVARDASGKIVWSQPFTPLKPGN
jgi:hypothetical protein